MDANSKMKLATEAIRFVATSYDDGDVAIKAHLAHLRKFIDECEAKLPADRAAHEARHKEFVANKEARRAANLAAAAKAAAAKRAAAAKAN